MPIETKVHEDLVKAIKKKKNPEKLQLIALYDLLIKMYNEDDRYQSELRTSTFEKTELIRNLYNEALSILKSEIDINPEQIENPSEFFSVEEQNSLEYKKIEKSEKPENFFLRVLLSIPFIKENISDNDKKVLKYLDHIEILNFQENDNYRIEFYFKENEFFYNDKLIIEAIVNEDEEYDGDISEIKGDMIEWKKDMNYLIDNKNEEKEEIKTGISFFWIFKNFKADDLKEDDDEEYHEYDMDPLSDKSLFGVSVDTLQIFRNSFMIYVIPAIFGIEVPDFLDDDDYEDDKSKEEGDIKVEEEDSSCKTQ